MSANEFNKENCDLRHKLEEEKRNSLHQYVESIDKRVSEIEQNRKEKIKTNWYLVTSIFLCLLSVIFNVVFTKGC